MKRSREFYIPKDSVECHYPHANATTYSYEKDGKFFCRAFSGKRSKPDWMYYFKSHEQREAHVMDWIKTIHERMKVIEERKQKRLNFVHSLKLGYILECSWGYDQTNVDFYQVTEIIGKSTIKIREIDSTSVKDESGVAMTGLCVPVKNSFKTNSVEMVKKVRPGNYVSISSYASASLWDGMPCRYSWYG